MSQSRVMSLGRVEHLAAAVDAVVVAHGLNTGEALWGFTAMLMESLKNADPEVRDVLRDAVIEALNTSSLRPLVKIGIMQSEERVN